jgi:hypothetical protein
VNDVAVYRNSVSNLTLEEAITPLHLLRIMRQRAVEELRPLVPEGRIHWVFARAYPQTYTLMGLVSEDNDKALRLAQRSRTTRRLWFGYRTDFDYWKDQPE